MAAHLGQAMTLRMEVQSNENIALQLPAPTVMPGDIG